MLFKCIKFSIKCNIYYYFINYLNELILNHNLTQALLSISEFHDIINFIEYFRTLKSHQKMKVSVFFGKAALQVGRWDLLEMAIKYMPDDSVPEMVLKAMNAIHKGEP